MTRGQRIAGFLEICRETMTKLRVLRARRKNLTNERSVMPERHRERIDSMLEEVREEEERLHRRLEEGMAEVKP